MLPIVSTYTLCLNQGILKENFISLLAAHSISLLLLTGAAMKGLKWILLFFEMGDVSNIQICPDHLFSTSGSKRCASATCTRCRWSWGMSGDPARERWRPAGPWSSRALSLLQWHRGGDFARVIPHVCPLFSQNESHSLRISRLEKQRDLYQFRGEEVIRLVSSVRMTENKAALAAAYKIGASVGTKEKISGKWSLRNKKG